MNLILDHFKKWYTANKLTVNTNKIKYILFHRTHKPVTYSLFSLYLNNVSKVASTRFLGVVIHECLSWKGQSLSYIECFSKIFEMYFYFYRK